MKFVSKAERSFCVTLVPELIIWCAWNLNWKKLQKVDGLARTVKLKALQVETKMMNTMNFVENARTVASCFVVIPAHGHTTLSVLIPHSRKFQMETGGVHVAL